MSTITITCSKTAGYSKRTAENAAAADLTVAIAADFMTAGERLTRRVAGKNYLLLDIHQPALHNARSLYREMKARDAHHLNIAGNGMHTLAKHGFTQTVVNDYLHQIISRVHAHWPIESIRSGGQTGVDIAGVIAGHALHIPVTAHMPPGCLQRDQYGNDREYDAEEITAYIRTCAASLRPKPQLALDIQPPHAS